MKITKVSDVEAPVSPLNPNAPMSENIGDDVIYQAFQKLIAGNKINWHRDSDLWIEMESNGQPMFYTYYSGFVGTNALYRVDVYLYPSNLEGLYAKAIIDLRFQLQGGKSVAKWEFSGTDVIRKTPFINYLAQISIRGLKTPGQMAFSDIRPEKDVVRLTRAGGGITNDNQFRPATEAKITVGPIRPIKSGESIRYEVFYIIRDLETGQSKGKKIFANSSKDCQLSSLNA